MEQQPPKTECYSSGDIAKKREKMNKNITIMFILRAEDSFAARILPLSARAKQGSI